VTAALDPLARYEAGEITPTVALMLLLVRAKRLEQVEREIDERLRTHALQRSDDTCALLHALRDTIERHRAGCGDAAALLRGLDELERDESADRVERIRRIFDWAVEQSEAGSVALCSLGDPALLDAGTAEVVAALEAWGVLGRYRRVLQIGCGTGRFEAALASRVAEVWGIDVSAGMIARARRRCRGLGNVHLAQCSGRDLADFESGRFDLVYAVDSVPYIVQAESGLVERHFAEVRRVLRPGGDFMLFNYSYRDDVALDRADVGRLAAEYGFRVLVDGTRPFRLWDGVAFQLRAGLGLGSAESS
jgi:SAM-dependent methyltransferase